MIRIVADTSTLYSTAQAKAAGFDVSPLTVTINSKTYREFDEISAEEFVEIIRQGHLPVSSQPAIGVVAALYEQYQEDEIINLALADGLSGAYRSAVAAAELVEDAKRITVQPDPKGVAGFQSYLTRYKAALAAQKTAADMN